jgi:hypothetical protein
VDALKVRLRLHDNAYVASRAPSVATTLERSGCTALATEMWAMLAEAQFRAGQVEAGREALARAESGAAADGPLAARLAILRASILGAADWPTAQRLGAEAVELASRAGFLVELYEARLVREERRWKDDPGEALRQLADLRAETARHGLVSLAGRAATFTLRARATPPR